MTTLLIMKVSAFTIDTINLYHFPVPLKQAGCRHHAEVSHHRPDGAF